MGVGTFFLEWGRGWGRGFGCSYSIDIHNYRVTLTLKSAIREHCILDLA